MPDMDSRDLLRGQEPAAATPACSLPVVLRMLQVALIRKGTRPCVCACVCWRSCIRQVPRCPMLPVQPGDEPACLTVNMMVSGADNQLAPMVNLSSVSRLKFPPWVCHSWTSLNTWAAGDQGPTRSNNGHLDVVDFRLFILQTSENPRSRGDSSSPGQEPHHGNADGLQGNEPAHERTGHQGLDLGQGHRGAAQQRPHRLHPTSRQVRLMRNALRHALGSLGGQTCADSWKLNM